MSRGRRAVQLTAEEVEAFLAERMKVQVATVGPDGAPHLTTLFYVMLDGRIAFWTYGSSQKVVNLRRDPRITCLVEDGDDYFELRGVSIRGRAVLLEEYDDVRALGRQVAARMAHGQVLDAEGERLLGDLVDAQARKRVGVVVEPEHVASWDHRKLGSLPGLEG